MRTQSSFNRPYPRTTTPEDSGLGIRTTRNPQLVSRWTVGEDGRLTCQWSF